MISSIWEVEHEWILLKVKLSKDWLYYATSITWCGM